METPSGKCTVCGKHKLDLLLHINKTHSLSVWCKYCQTSLQGNGWRKHLLSNSHQRNVEFSLNAPTQLEHIRNEISDLGPYETMVVAPDIPTENQSQSDKESDDESEDSATNFVETLPEVDREPLPEESTTEIIAESNTLSTEKLLAWISKFAISQQAATELFQLLKSETISPEELPPSYQALQKISSRKHHISRKEFIGVSPQKNYGVPISLFSMKEILQKYLETPVGFGSIIPSYNGDSVNFSHFTTGIYFKKFSEYVETTHPHCIPLSILLFYDPFPLGKKNKIGNIYIGVLNCSENVLLSPKTKLTVAILPHNVSLDVILPTLAEDIQRLEQTPLKISINNNEYLFIVRLSMLNGDSFVR
jgi:hypothetical protein